MVANFEGFVLELKLTWFMDDCWCLQCFGLHSLHSISHPSINTYGNDLSGVRAKKLFFVAIETVISSSEIVFNFVR